MTSRNAAAALASIVFFKIHEFAQRSVSEQARLRAQLEAVVAVTIAPLAPPNRIVLEAADGAVVVVIGDPSGALRLAEQALAATAAGLPLAIGINHGAIQTEDTRNASGLTGDGIAVAASIAAFAASGGMLISRSFRSAITAAAPGSEASLFPAGIFSDDALREYELFGLERRGAIRRDQRLWACALVAAIAIIGAGITVRATADGEDTLIKTALVQVRATTAQGERYLRALLDPLPWQKN
jgi:class 3 adenylate cyclase